MSQNKPIIQQQPNNPNPYGKPIFLVPERVKAYTKFGRTGCVAATVRVPLLAIPGLEIETVIAGTKTEKDGASEISFECWFPRSLKATGDDAGTIRDSFMAHVESACLKWAGYDGATDAAVAAITGNKIRPTGTAKAAPERPRLVKPAQPAQPAAVPPAVPQTA